MKLYQWWSWLSSVTGHKIFLSTVCVCSLSYQKPSQLFVCLLVGYLSCSITYIIQNWQMEQSNTILMTQNCASNYIYVLGHGTYDCYKST